jgi:aspartyl-tRNA(Asn)/glutamyl-tRNA(Gln) amidotransferase subunit C
VPDVPHDSADHVTVGSATAAPDGPGGHITRADVAYLARLARLAVSDDELDVFVGQLDVILGSVARVGEVAADDIPPTSHAVPMTNVYRPDVVVPSLPRDVILAAAPAVEDYKFRVPRILAEEA